MISAPITCAKDRPLFPAEVQPNMSSAFQNWTETGPVQIVRSILVEGEAQKKTRTVTASTCVQPLSAQKIAMKPEGERAWKWWQIVASLELDAEIGDLIEIGRVGYRVLGRWDYSRNGFRQFEATEDYRHV